MDVAPVATSRRELTHGDHVHAFDMTGREAPVPPLIKLKCGACGKLVRETLLTADGSVYVVGGVSPEGQPGELAQAGGRIKDRKKHRAADCFDASPDGWDSNRPPTH